MMFSQSRAMAILKEENGGVEKMAQTTTPPPT
jgi:hypothetical protein